MKPNTNNKENKLYYVFSKEKAIQLRERGFKIVKRTPNFKYPEFDMYGFENTPVFREAFEELTGCKVACEYDKENKYEQIKRKFRNTTRRIRQKYMYDILR